MDNKKTNCSELQNTRESKDKQECEDGNSQKTKITLNLNATEYVPKKKQQITNNIADEKSSQEKVEKLNLNLEAKAYEPKSQNVINREQVQDEDEDYYFDEEEIYKNDVKIIVDDIIENEEIEDDESDEDKWFPKYKDCECCQGFVYKCNGETCQNLLSCYCKVKAQCDDYY